MKFTFCRKETKYIKCTVIKINEKIKWGIGLLDERTEWLKYDSGQNGSPDQVTLG